MSSGRKLSKGKPQTWPAGATWDPAHTPTIRLRWFEPHHVSQDKHFLMAGDILCPEQHHYRYQTSGKRFHSGKVTGATQALPFPPRKAPFATSQVCFQGKTLPVS